jgi:hypothetical protein
MAMLETYAADAVEREDLSDLIYNISPTDTPFLTAAGTTTATAVAHSWVKDSLTAPQANLQVEGADLTVGAGDDGTRFTNYTQISAVAFGVSGTLENVSKAGRDSEIAYQAAKRARELKTDVEFALITANQARAVGSDSVARASASFKTYLTKSDLASAGTPGVNPTGDGTDNGTDGTTRAFAQSQLDNVIQQVWEGGGSPSVIMAGPTQKTNLSGFDGVGNITSASTMRTDRADGTIYATADVYVSNFGTLHVVPTRHIRQTATVDREVFVIDPEYVKVAYLRSWQEFELSKTGDSINREMLVEYCLEVCNNDAHGVVADLS